MSLHGLSLIASQLATPGSRTFRPTSPLDGGTLEPAFHDATPDQIDRAVFEAVEAFALYRRTTPEQRAVFLEKIADELMALGDALLERAHLESGLPLDRLTGERGRTCGQLRAFAQLVREGSWVDARVDTALPERKPLPRPDLRRMLVPLGPVVVFGASNFPLAFSVAGGDTASALAAGCPVLVRAHPAHPGASELAATAIQRAAAACGLPAGVCSLIQGTGHEIGVALVKHPQVRAAGFTGSLAGGRALFDAAATRLEPIPFFAEMSSINPVVLLPGALAERAEQIAEGMKNSMTLGVGQFCTKPGLVLAVAGADLERFTAALAAAVLGTKPATMLHAGIRDAYVRGADALRAVPGVSTLALAQTPADAARTEAQPLVAITDASHFLARPELQHEVFGPAALVVTAPDAAALRKLARALGGQLTATIHGTEADLAAASDLVEVLAEKAGRLVFNSFPTGVEVCPAMQHGGPYPATTDSRFTSVGTAAIQRWARPVCWQGFPAAALPTELTNENPRGILRTINGELTRDLIK